MKRIELLNLDCETALMLMENGSIDLTVTSPPYDSLRAYEGLPFEKFKKVAEELFRVTKKGGVVVWVVGDQTLKGSETGTSFRQALYFKHCGFNLHDTMIYQKTALAFPETNRYYPGFEYMFVFSKGPPKTVNLIVDRANVSAGRKVTGLSRQKDHSLTARSGSGNICKPFGVRWNIWPIHNSARGLGHPAPFPESLASDHIRTWSNPGDTVFDPFLGSGTTGKMAIALKCNFIGVELDEKYFKMAQERIGNVK
jgi:DNA modification methylase